MSRTRSLAALLTVALLAPVALAQRELYPSSPSTLRPAVMPSEDRSPAGNAAAGLAKQNIVQNQGQVPYNLSTVGRGMSPYSVGYRNVAEPAAYAPRVIDAPAPAYSSAAPYSMRTSG